MQATRTITRNLPSGLSLRRRQHITTAHSPAPNLKPQLLSPNNPPIDSDQLAYRLCELSLQKMQKEARASEPDIRHVLACNSLRRLAQQDLLRRLDALQKTINVHSIPLLPGADEFLDLDDDTMDMKSLEIAIHELEIASRRGEKARVVCFQQISDM